MSFFILGPRIAITCNPETLLGQLLKVGLAHLVMWRLDPDVDHLCHLSNADECTQATPFVIARMIGGQAWGIVTVSAKNWYKKLLYNIYF